MLWGFPFLTVGEGLSPVDRVARHHRVRRLRHALGPVIGALSSRHPMRRSHMLVLPTIAIQVVAWLVGHRLARARRRSGCCSCSRSPSRTGGPASMIAFDHARTFNPSHRLSTATGIVNGGGFLAGLIAIFLIGLAMDLQGAGTPDDLHARGVPHRVPHPGAAVGTRHGLHRLRAQAHPRAPRPRSASAAQESVTVTPSARMRRDLPPLRPAADRAESDVAVRVVVPRLKRHDLPPLCARSRPAHIGVAGSVA